MGIEYWRNKQKEREKQKDRKVIEPLEHGGFILGEALAENSTSEIRKLYAKELSQTKINGLR